VRKCQRGPVGPAGARESAAPPVPAPPVRRRLVGLEDAAALLGVSPWTVRELEWGGHLPRVRLPRVRRLLFDLADLDQLITDSKR